MVGAAETLIASGGGVTVIVTSLLVDRTPSSVTFTVNVTLPSVSGVPVILPVELIVNQDGGLTSDHVYGAFPPDAVGRNVNG